MSVDTSLSAVQDFLAQRRIALVGLSQDPKHFSHAVYKELDDRDYVVVPVNPAHAGEALEGAATYASVADIPEPVDGALIMTSAEHSAEAVQDCIDALVPRVWLYRGVGHGAVSDEAVQLLADAGVDCVVGECPLMYLANAQWVHRFHGWTKKVAGSYPH